MVARGRGGEAAVVRRKAGAGAYRIREIRAGQGQEGICGATAGEYAWFGGEARCKQSVNTHCGGAGDGPGVGRGPQQRKHIDVG